MMQQYIGDNKYTSEPSVSVGIVSGREISFSLYGHYTAEGRLADDRVVRLPVPGPATRLTLLPGSDFLQWSGCRLRELTFSPACADDSFSLEDVVIGVHFHWQRKETQTFRGTLRLLVVGDKIQAINVLPVEQYLESVISSEMSATSSLALLEAHAVISRSWLLAQMERRTVRNDDGVTEASYSSKPASADVSPAARRDAASAETHVGEIADPHPREILRWYDREDHTLFDVCADDHCQRYQGITRATNPHVAEAVRATRGQLLTYDGKICDARFSKCCGGATEEFQYCWENKQMPYLRAVADRLQGKATRPDASPSTVVEGGRLSLPDLTDEQEADRWIRSVPPSFCNTQDKQILSQVLNTYDQETHDFYRWTVRLGQEELQALLKEKLDADLGTIVDLRPVARGKSGRLYRLEIVGTRDRLVIGKELEIRRALSKTHLYSSAFVVDREYSDGGAVPSAFVLTGAGWGHGVGLCQIGAAVMGACGYGYRTILAHYYPGAELRQAYA